MNRTMFDTNFDTNAGSGLVINIGLCAIIILTSKWGQKI